MDRLRLFWKPQDLSAMFGRPIHIVAGSNQARTHTAELVVHSDSRPLPAGSFVEIADGVFVESPALIYARAARRLTFSQLVALGMELCGTYALSPSALDAPMQQAGNESRRPTQEGATFDLHAVLSPLELRAYLSSLEAAVGTHVHGSSIGRAQQAAHHIYAESGSPMETVTYELACLPYSRGGYCLPVPVLNAKLDGLGRRTSDSSFVAYRPDLLWWKGKLAFEYFGDNEHAGREADDLNRIRRLEQLGFTVHILKVDDLVNPTVFDTYMREVADACGKRLRLPANFPQRRIQLLSEILPR